MRVDVAKIKGKMAELGVTQADVAELLGIDTSTVNRKLNQDENSAFKIGEAQKLAQLLKFENPGAIFFADKVAETQ